jgi:hypothetical protein
MTAADTCKPWSAGVFRTSAAAMLRMAARSRGEATKPSGKESRAREKSPERRCSMERELEAGA